jgi:hypothetical protein
MNRIAQTHDPSALDGLQKTIILQEHEIAQKDKIISAQAKQLHYFETYFEKIFAGGRNMPPCVQKIYEKEFTHYNRYVETGSREDLVNSVKHLIASHDNDAELIASLKTQLEKINNIGEHHGDK